VDRTRRLAESRARLGRSGPRPRGPLATARVPPWALGAAAATALFVLACLFAVGGLLTNAHPGDIGHYQTFGERVRDGLVPYRTGFYVEYPPFALPVFIVPELISAAHYQQVFKVLMAIGGAITIVVVARTLGAAGATQRRSLALLAFVAAAPLLQGHTYINRYDFWPALLTAVALLALVLDRDRIGFAFLALSFASKGYALVLLPLAVLWVVRRHGAARLRGALVSFAATCAVVFGPFAAVALHGLGYSYYSQTTRGLQIESLGASLVLFADKLGVYDSSWRRGLSIDLAGSLPDLVAVASVVVEVAAVALVLWAYHRSANTDAATFLTACAAAVVAFVTFSKFLSPQFLVWLVPLVVLARREVVAPATALLGLALVFTQVDNTWGDWGLRNVNWTVWSLLARNACLVAVFALLTVPLVRAARGRAAPAPATLTP
jgi:uncharacterized membrane protein